ncbi:starch-binding protein [Orenia marismortui]|uniref:Putative starch-binding protein with CBM26 n=1 Tax=Orenia marismortui TaxID=46469 RepID=A0A4R8HA00_9FIRM|nr:starch-binding protein [Orenia marismortui]TDX52518.1 putative starch-binding protein with CBM26 [Orenia marismortui]
MFKSALERVLISVMVFLLLLTILGCSDGARTNTLSGSSNLKVTVKVPKKDTDEATDKIEEEFTVKKVEVSIVNRNNSNDKDSETKEIKGSSSSVSLNFNDLSRGSTYELDIAVKDEDGYIVYEDNDKSTTINGDDNLLTVSFGEEDLTDAKGLVIKLSNLISEVKSGKVFLTPSNGLKTDINIDNKVARFNEISANKYLLEIDLFDSDNNSIYEKTVSDLKILPGRVTQIEYDLAKEKVVNTTWLSTVAPKAPTGLTALATESGILLNWEDNSTNYMIYRGSDKSSKTPLEESTNNYYKDRTAMAGDTYYYWVKAIDKAGLNSELSTKVSATAIPSKYDGVKLHFKDSDAQKAPQIYTWYLNEQEEKIELSGSLEDMETMKSEDNDWYVAEFPEIRNINIIFVSGDGRKFEDLHRRENEWWYQEGRWYSYNPDKPAKPEIEFDLEPGSYDSETQLEISISGEDIIETSARFNNQDISLNISGEDVDKTTVLLGDYLKENESGELSVTVVNDIATITKTARFTIGDTDNKKDNTNRDFTFHFKNNNKKVPNIYLWQGKDEAKIEPTGVWPGTPMLEEEDGWYSYSLIDIEVEELNAKINWDSGDTGNIMGIEAGEWWYKDGKFVSKPEIIIDTPAGTYLGTKSITLSIKDNGDKIIDLICEFNGKRIDIVDKADIRLADYLENEETGRLTITASNQIGTVSREVTFTRQDRN